MERFDSVILITPSIGQYYGNNKFLKNLNHEELNFIQNATFHYSKKHNSYSDCIKDIKDKMMKIKKILEE